MKTNWKKIEITEFAECFGTTLDSLPDQAKNTLTHSDLRYLPATLPEIEKFVLDYLDRLQAPWIERQREENRVAWTKGWNESLEEIRRLGPGPLTCRPKYFRGSPYLRLRKGMVMTPNPQLEHDLLTATREYLFLRYLSNASNICELGSGSGQNLWLLNELFPKATTLGLDWVEPCVGIADEMAKAGRKTSGRLFDLTEPDESLQLAPGTAVISIHAFEQLDNNHGKILNWLLAQRPSIVVQHEPIMEFYDQTNLYDYLALMYSKKRHYLRDYYTALCALEKQNRIEIIEAKRPEVGGVYHEASVLIWKPK